MFWEELVALTFRVRDKSQLERMLFINNSRTCNLLLTIKKTMYWCFSLIEMNLGGLFLASLSFEYR